MSPIVSTLRSMSPSECASTASPECSFPMSHRSSTEGTSSLGIPDPDSDDVWASDGTFRKDKLDEMTKAIELLSSHNVAVLIHALSLRGQYLSAAVASAGAYRAIEAAFGDMRKVVDSMHDAMHRVLNDMSEQQRRAKEHQERCEGEYQKFNAYVDAFMKNPAHAQASSLMLIPGGAGSP